MRVWRAAAVVGVPQLRLFTIAGRSRWEARRSCRCHFWHGDSTILGYRLGSFAYMTDCSRIPDESWPLLEGVRVVIIDALRDRPHSTHFSVSQALDVVSRLGSERA